MNKGHTLLLTSGAGQFYHVEGVAHVVRNFRDDEAQMLLTAKNQSALRSAVVRLIKMGAIEARPLLEINCNPTRNERVTVSAHCLHNLDIAYADPGVVEENKPKPGTRSAMLKMAQEYANQTQKATAIYRFEHQWWWAYNADGPQNGTTDWTRVEPHPRKVPV